MRRLMRTSFKRRPSSAIFYHSEEQRAAASGRWKRPLVTEIVPAGTLWPTEVVGLAANGLEQA